MLFSNAGCLSIQADRDRSCQVFDLLLGPKECGKTTYSAPRADMSTLSRHIPHRVAIRYWKPNDEANADHHPYVQ